MLVAMLLASPLVAAPPVWASSGPGGANVSTSGGGAPSGGTSTTPGAGTVSHDADLLVTATSDGITLTTNVSALLGRHLTFTGAATPQSAGETIIVQRLNRQDAWVSVAAATVAAGGAFSVVWRTNHVGRLIIRAILERTPNFKGTANSTGTGEPPPTLLVTVFRPARATFYGQGFYGQRTACGQILRRGTLGVASRTLKCGTPVQLYYGGRMIVVPVIDRGPYANGAKWDLTQATANQLGITGTVTIGAAV